jgi:hypothetical protein
MRRACSTHISGEAVFPELPQPIRISHFYSPQETVNPAVAFD